MSILELARKAIAALKAYFTSSAALKAENEQLRSDLAAANTALANEELDDQGLIDARDAANAAKERAEARVAELEALEADALTARDELAAELNAHPDAPNVDEDLNEIPETDGTPELPVAEVPTEFND